ncbi:MAG TPA: LLM class F420-dependent oxidoreductase [Acidimicrobiales bacterium]|jgi:F420-dependent oxidoreductase-like protein
MRYGIKTVPQHTSWQAMVDIWRAADDIDVFESAWNWDHFYPLTGDFHGPNFEGWMMLAAMAQATRRIRLGVQVSGMVYRHPAVMANMAATVDVISNGRLELGLGAAWNQMECDAYGIDLPPLTERFDRFDEGVEAIVGLLTQETTTYQGRYVQLTDAWCEPKPIQQPHPPIVIGGRGPKRTLRTAARWAQQWNAIMQDPEDWPGLKDVLVGHCQAIGRDPNEITCSVNVRMAGPGDVGQALETAARYRDLGVDLMIFNLPQPFDPAVLEPLAEGAVALG